MLTAGEELGTQGLAQSWASGCATHGGGALWCVQQEQPHVYEKADGLCPFPYCRCPGWAFSLLLGAALRTKAPSNPNYGWPPNCC